MLPRGAKPQQLCNLSPTQGSNLGLRSLATVEKLLTISDSIDRDLKGEFGNSYIMMGFGRLLYKV